MTTTTNAEGYASDPAIAAALDRAAYWMDEANRAAFAGQRGEARAHRAASAAAYATAVRWSEALAEVGA